MAFLITCPLCGPRDAYEFRFGGEDKGPRPDQESLGPEAWCDYVSDGLKFDTMRELGEVDEATAEAIEDQWDAIASWAQSRLHYNDGWHGDHSPPFHDCVSETIVDALQRTFLACLT